MRSPSSSMCPEFGSVHARYVLDERRLARAIVADERQNLAAHQREIDAAERLDRAEALSETLDGENRLHRVFANKRQMFLLNKTQVGVELVNVFFIIENLL